MEAEEQFSCGGFESAKESYNLVIALAGSHKFINDEALAHEIAVKFYFETRDLSTSLGHYRFVHEKYCKRARWENPVNFLDLSMKKLLLILG